MNVKDMPVWFYIKVPLFEKGISNNETRYNNKLLSLNWILPRSDKNKEVSLSVGFTTHGLLRNILFTLLSGRSIYSMCAK